MVRDVDIGEAAVLHQLHRGAAQAVSQAHVRLQLAQHLGGHHGRVDAAGGQLALRVQGMGTDWANPSAWGLGAQLQDHKWVRWRSWGSAPQAPQAPLAPKPLAPQFPGQALKPPGKRRPSPGASGPGLAPAAQPRTLRAEMTASAIS